MRTEVSISCIFIFFFFQAEDGIRDKLVTGVQTCALPIWAVVATALVIVLADMLDNALGERGGRDLDCAGQLAGEIVGHALGGDGPLDEIGRASCRERV